MKDENKTKRQLIGELVELRRRITELEEAETKRKRAEGSLQVFKAIVEASGEAIAISDSEGQLVYINPAHEKLFGRSLEEASRLNYREYYPPESVRVLDEVVVPALARGESWEGELDVFDANGHRFPLWERADSIRDADGEMLFGFGLMHDITERKRAEAELRRHRDHLKELVEERTTELMRANEQLRQDITERKRAEEALKRQHDHLEELVRERTAELRKLINAMAGREVRMAELKDVIRRLRAQLEEAGLTPLADDPLLGGESTLSTRQSQEEAP